MTKHVYWIICLSVLQVLLVSAIVIKLVYFTGAGIHIDPESGQILKSNIFRNDRAVYAAYLTISDNQKAFMDEKWFTKIKNDISQQDLLVQWGFYGPRVKLIFTQSSYFGWSLIGKLATRISETHKDAFYLMILFLPVLVGLKYISLLVFPLIYRQPIVVVPMLYACLLLDFIEPPLKSSSESFAWQFFAIGFVLWVFNEKRSIVCYLLAYSLLIYASLTSLVLVPIVTSIVGVHLLLVGVCLKPDKLGIHFKKLLEWNDERFLWIASTILLLTIPLAAINFFLNMMTYPMKSWSIHLTGGNLTYKSWMFSMISIHLSYLYSLKVIACLLAVEFTSNKMKSLESDYKVLTLKLFVTLSLVAAFSLVLISPVLSNVSAMSTNRLIPSIVATSLIYLVYVIWKYECVRKGIIKNYRVCLIVGLLIISLALKYNIPHFRPTISNSFNDSEFPELIGENQSKRYYLAERPQQIFLYFIENLYNHAPLVLNINTKKYNEENVVRDLFDNN